MTVFRPTVIVPAPLKPEVRATLMAITDRVIDNNLNGASKTETRLGTMMEYGHAAKKLCKAWPEIPFRTAFALIRSEMAHAVA